MVMSSSTSTHTRIKKLICKTDLRYKQYTRITVKREDLSLEYDLYIEGDIFNKLDDSEFEIENKMNTEGISL